MFSKHWLQPFSQLLTKLIPVSSICSREYDCFDFAALCCQCLLFDAAYWQNPP